MLRKSLIGLVPVVLAIVAYASPVQAKHIYTLNVGATNPILDDGNDFQGGMGFELKAGMPIPFPFFDIELEAKIGRHGWNGKGTNGNASMFRGSVGARGGVNFALFPYGFVHVGYGRLSDWVYAKEPVAGPNLEVGIGLDVTAIPYMRIGLFGSYNHMMLGDTGYSTGLTDDDMQWFSYGLALSWTGDGGDDD